MKIIELAVTSPEVMIDITEQVQDYVAETRLKDGFVHIQIPDDTCAVTLNTNVDFSIDKDFFNKLNHCMPKYNGMQFTGFNTSRTKAALTGQCLQVMVENGTLILGLHQSIYFADFAGPAKSRRVFLSVMGTTLKDGETAAMPEALAALYQKDKEAEEAERAEQERIIAEMRAEAAERARQYKEEEKRRKEQENGQKQD